MKILDRDDTGTGKTPVLPRVVVCPRGGGEKTSGTRFDNESDLIGVVPEGVGEGH